MQGQKIVCVNVPGPKMLVINTERQNPGDNISSEKISGFKISNKDIHG